VDQNILFRWIWRLNALLLLGTLAVIAVLAAPQVWQAIWWQYAGTNAGYAVYGQGPASAASPDQNSYGLSLDFVRPGRKETVLVLAPVHSYPQVSESGSYEPQTRADYNRVANYLFVDPKTGDSRWLFLSNNQIITSTGYVYDSGIPDVYVPYMPRFTPSGPARAVLYEVKPEGGSKFQLYVSKLDGSNLVKLLDDLDHAPTETADAETISVRYATGGHEMLAVFATGDFKQLVVKDISKESKK
jgi:hypothetical protein